MQGKCKKILTLWSAFICISLGFVSSEPAFSQWVKTNGPYGGRIYSLVIKPDTNGTVNLFAATDENGVFLSSNNGQIWTKVSSGLTDRSFSTLCRTGEKLLAGSLNENIYSSSDNGKTWDTLMSSLTGDVITSISTGQNSNGGENIYASTFGSGIYRSTDNGQNWENISSGLPYPYINTSLAVDSLLFIAADSNGVYSSTNCGEEWVKAYQTTRKITAYSFASMHNKEGLLKVYAGGYGCIYISEDNGKTWIQREIPKFNPQLYSRIRALCLLDSGTGQTDLFAGTESLGILHSTDDGLTWNQLNNGLTDLWVLDLKPYQGNIFAATTSGVFLSTDRGNSWKSVNKGLMAINVTALEYAYGKAGEENIFAGTFGQGVFLTSDKGANWTDINSGLKSKDVTSLLRTDSSLFAGTAKGIFVSTENGLNWMRAAQYDWTLNVVNSLALCKNKLFAATDQGLFSSADNGNTWAKASTELPSLYNFSAVAASGDSMWTSSSKGIFSSFNGGLNWSPMNNGFPSLLVNSFFITSDETGRKKIYAGTGTGVYVSDDNTQTWNRTGLNLPETSFISFAAYGKNLFAATSTGVLVSKDGGSVWEEFNTGLDENYAGSIRVIGSYLYAGTLSGMFRRPLSDLTGVNNFSGEAPAGFSLKQNYPNPFNPATTINYSVPEQGFVELKVFDMLGREIQTLISREQRKGSYRVQFDAAGLSSGIYIYRLRTGKYTSVRRMMLVK